MDTNRKWNREICDQFDKMATRLGEIPDKTRELVELQRYLKASMTETLPVIKSFVVNFHKYCNFDEHFLFQNHHNQPLFFVLETHVKNWNSDPESSISVRLYTSSSRRYSAEHSCISMAKRYGFGF